MNNLWEQEKREHPKSGHYQIWICVNCSRDWHNPKELEEVSPQ